MRRCAKYNAQRGFTLVELMIAMVIASVIVAGASGVMLSQTRLHDRQIQNSHNNRSLRRVIANIRRNLVFAGYLVPRTMVVVDPDESKNGISVAAGDILDIRAGNPLGQWEATSSGTTRITLGKSLVDGVNPTWSAGQSLLIFDSPGNMVVMRSQNARATNASAVTLVSEYSRTVPVQTGDVMKVGLIDRHRYYIINGAAINGEPVTYLVDDQLKDINGDGKVDSNDVMPLASNISDFEVRYFLDSNNDGYFNDAEMTTGYTAANGIETAAKRGNLKAIQVTITAQKVDKKSGDVSYDTISEFMMLRNMETSQGPTADNSINNFTWIGAESLRVIKDTLGEED